MDGGKVVAYVVCTLFIIFGAAGFAISVQIGNDFLAGISCIPALAGATAILLQWFSPPSRCENSSSNFH